MKKNKKAIDRDDKVTQLLSTAMDMILLNLGFIVCCIPIITIGAAVTAMYVTMSKRKKETASPVRVFFEEFKRNFKVSTICWLVECVILLSSALLFKISVNHYSEQQKFWLGTEWISVVVFVVASVVGSVMFPLISRYENSVKMYFKNAFLFTISFPGHILLNLILFAVPVFFLVFNQGLFLRIGVIFPLFGFSLLFFLSNLIFSKMFTSFERLSADSKPVDSE